jgi:hypothetical protein
MSLGELAAFVCTRLKKRGIEAVLSGGACVSIYTDGGYQSFDLDFIERVPAGGKRIKEALLEIGFVEKDRYFVNPDTDFFIDLPAGPLAIGSEPVREVREMAFSTGRLSLLSPTDCVKDRLAAYYHWNDRQSLEQALLVAEMREIDLKEIRRWSGVENKLSEFNSIRTDLSKASRGRRRS